MLQRLQLRGLRRNVITYNAANSACKTGRQPQHALHMLQKLLLRGLRQDVITYNAAISACEKGQRPQEALQLLQELQLRGPLAQRDEIAPRDDRTSLVCRMSAFRLIDSWLSTRWIPNYIWRCSLEQTAMN